MPSVLLANVIISANNFYLDTEPFNIICNHMRFQIDEVQTVMPKNSLFVSILREPGELFESSFHYFYELVPSFQKVAQNHPESTETWLNNTDRFFNPKSRSVFWFFAKNHMMYDFGHDPIMEDDKKIADAIKAIDRTFDFIMISNYMDESLVLLADMLCWPLADVSSVVLNQRTLQKQTKARKKRIREKVREWNKADSALFDYFNKSLWKKIESFGAQKMQEEVKKLQEINQDLKEKCVDSNGTKFYSDLKNTPWKNMNIFQPTGVKIAGFDLKPGAEQNETCVNLIAPEPYLNKVVRAAQRNRLAQAKINPRNYI